MSLAPEPASARQLEEGGIVHRDHASSPASTAVNNLAPHPTDANGIVQGAVPASVQQQHEEAAKKRHRHHLHLHRKKEKVESKLPGIMQGAQDVNEAHKRLTIKNEIVAAVGEFVGTFLFLFFSFGIATIAGQQNLNANSAQQVQNTGGDSAGSSLDTAQLLYSSLGFGFSLATNAWCFFRVSGGLFNPSIAFALFLTGSLTWYRFITLVIMEVLGALSAAGMAQVLLPGGMNARAKLSGSTTVGQGFCIEMFMTAQLVFAVFMLAGEKHRGTFLAPVGIGLALFIAEMWATGFTGGALNPVRALGPDVVAHQFESTTWIYYTAPFAGALIATIVYKLLKYSSYETAVEGQDDDDLALVMKDEKGQVTGFVDRVGAPEAEAEGLNRVDSRPASIISADGATTAAHPLDDHANISQVEKNMA